MDVSSSIEFWVGTYTTPAPHVPGACGKGILRGSLDLKTGNFGLAVAAPDASNSSYLAVGPDGRLFAVAEQPDGEGGFCIYRLGTGRSLKLEAKLPSGGSSPCHLAVVGEEVVLAHYMGDRLQVFRRTKEGEDWERREGAPYAGSGPVISRQQESHPHQVMYLAQHRQLTVCDLGSDRIWLHRVGDSGVGEVPVAWLNMPPGTGPRHLVYEGRSDSLYVLGELSGRVLHYRREASSWNLIANRATVDSGSVEPSGAAIKLHPSGKVLYVSERATCQIFVFRIHPESGELEPEGSISSRGKGPRDFGIDPTGRWLLALNQNSNSVAAFPLNSFTGLPTGEEGPVVFCETPVCIVFGSVGAE